MSLETIRNFLMVTDKVGTAGQPSEEELAELASAGFEAVVNLGLLDPRYCLRDEAGLARSLGLLYEHIPVEFGAPTVEQFRAFVSTMDAWQGRNVLVHCAANYRASSFFALYAELRLGWNRERADGLARILWPLDDVWTDFLARCRRECGMDGGGER